MTSATEREAPAPPEGLQQWNRFAVLKAEKEVGVLSNELSGQSSSKHARRKHQAIVVDEPLLHCMT